MNKEGKVINIRISNDNEFHHEGNCLALRRLPSEAERLSPVTGFSIRTEQPLFSLHTLHQYYAEISTSLVKKCSARLLYTTLRSKRLSEKDVKNDAITSRRHPDVMHERRLTPPGERRYFPALVFHAENRIGYVRNGFLSHVKILDFFWSTRKVHSLIFLSWIGLSSTVGKIGMRCKVDY